MKYVNVQNKLMDWVKIKWRITENKIKNKLGYDRNDNELTPWRKNPKVHHRTHNSPPTVPVLSQSNPSHTPQANLPKIESDPIFPPTPSSFKWSISFGLSH
jgi:hypothetical protein